MRELLFAIVQDLTAFGTPRWRVPTVGCRSFAQF
jgi:hypothetical protein